MDPGINSQPFSFKLFVAIIGLLGVEYLRLPAGASVFRILVVPLCLLGVFYHIFSGFSRKAVPFLLPVFCFPVMLGLAYLRWNEIYLLVAAIGLIPFCVFVFLHIVRNGWPLAASVILAMWSLPHFLTLVLFHLGLWGEAFTTHAERFDGLHFDANLMVVFVLASSTAKGVLLLELDSLRIRILLGIGLSVDLFMIAITGSRGGAFGFLLVLVFFGVYRFGVRKVLAGLALIGSVIALAFSLGALVIPGGLIRSPVGLVIQRVFIMDQLGLDINTVSSGRLYLWARAIDVIKAKGWFVGYTVENFVSDNNVYPHSTYFDAALDTGIPGIVVLIVMMGFSGIVLFRYFRDLDSGEIQGLLLGVSFGVTLIFLSCFSTKAFWLAVLVPYALSVRRVGSGHRSLSKMVDNVE